MGLEGFLQTGCGFCQRAPWTVLTLPMNLIRFWRQRPKNNVNAPYQYMIGTRRIREECRGWIAIIERAWAGDMCSRLVLPWFVCTGPLQPRAVLANWLCFVAFDLSRTTCKASASNPTTVSCRRWGAGHFYQGCPVFMILLMQEIK